MFRSQQRMHKPSPPIAAAPPLTRIPTPPLALAVEDDALSSILLPFFIADGTYVVNSEELPPSVEGAGPNPPQVSVWEPMPALGGGALRADPCPELFGAEPMVTSQGQGGVVSGAIDRGKGGRGIGRSDQC